MRAGNVKGQAGSVFQNAKWEAGAEATFSERSPRMRVRCGIEDSATGTRAVFPAWITKGQLRNSSRCADSVHDPVVDLPEHCSRHFVAGFDDAC